MCPFTLSAVVYILLAGVEESTDTYKRVCSKIPHKMQMETLSACSIQKVRTSIFCVPFVAFIGFFQRREHIVVAKVEALPHGSAERPTKKGQT